MAIGQGLIAPSASTTTTVAAPPAKPAALPDASTVSARQRSAGVTRRARPVVNGRITIPSVGIDLETYQGVDPWTLRFGPGHWEITAMPGEVGNTTFAGHRTTYTHPFYDIDRIAIGDEVVFTNSAGRFTYRATDHFVVNDTDVWIGNPTDTPTFTLFACHPKGSERLRYVVKGELVRAEPAEAAASVEESSRPGPAPQRRTCLLCGAT